MHFVAPREGETGVVTNVFLFGKGKTLEKPIKKKPFKMKDRSLKIRMGSGVGTRGEGVRHPTASD